MVVPNKSTLIPPKTDNNKISSKGVLESQENSIPEHPNVNFLPEKLKDPATNKKFGRSGTVANVPEMNALVKKQLAEERSQTPVFDQPINKLDETMSSIESPRKLDASGTSKAMTHRKSIVSNQNTILIKKPTIVRRNTSNSVGGEEDLAAELREEAILYFKTPVEQRTRKNMEVFIEMISVVPFFAKQFQGLVTESFDNGDPTPNSDEFFLDCLEGFEIEYFEPGECLFHHGSWGDRLYYILEGDVQIYVPKNEEMIKSADSAFERRYDQVMCKSQSVNRSSSQTMFDDDSKFKIFRQNYERRFPKAPQLMECMEAIYKNNENADFKFIIDNFGDFMDFYKPDDWIL